MYVLCYGAYIRRVSIEFCPTEFEYLCVYLSMRCIMMKKNHNFFEVNRFIIIWILYKYVKSSFLRNEQLSFCRTASKFWAGTEPDSKFKHAIEDMNFSYSLTQPGPKLMSEDSHIDLVADLTSSTDILFGICSTNNTHRHK